MSEVIKYRQLDPSIYEIQELSLKEFNEEIKVKLFTEEDSKILKDEAERILNEAKAEAEKLLKNADEEARSLVIMAERKVEDFRKEGLRQGYEEGLKKSEAEMDEKYALLFEKEASELRVFLQSVKDAYKDAIRTAERPLAKLALDIAEKVIREEAAKNNEVIISNIRESLLKISDKANIVIRVNPAQFDLVSHYKPKLIAAIEGIDDFALRNDPKVDLGGCVIDTPSGSVEARIDKQISELRKVITAEGKEDLDASGNT